MNKLQSANRVTQHILSPRGEMWQSNKGYYTGYLLGAVQLRRVARGGGVIVMGTLVATG